MTFAMTGANPRLCDKKTAFALLDRFLEAGGNFIDTADVYSVSDTWHVTSCETFVTGWRLRARYRRMAGAARGPGHGPQQGETL